MRFVSILIPTFNERRNLPFLIRSISLLFNREGIRGEAIVIDDNSPDGTGRVADSLAGKYPFLRVIHRSSKQGIGSAYKEGLKHATGDAVVTLDADLSHDVRYIPGLLERLELADLVVASRRNSAIAFPRGAFRRSLSSLAGFMVMLFFGAHVSDATSGFRAYKRASLDIVSRGGIFSDGFAVQVELLVRMKRDGFRVSELPFVFRDRAYGGSKLDAREILGSSIDFLRLCLPWRSGLF